MIGTHFLNLLQFDAVKEMVAQRCFSDAAKDEAYALFPSPSAELVLPELRLTAELRAHLASSAFFPSVEHDRFSDDLELLSLGGVIDGPALLRVMKGAEIANSMLRFLNEKREELVQLHALASPLRSIPAVPAAIDRVIDNEGVVKSGASHELASIRKQIADKKRESDRRFYHILADLRKLGYLRENEEGFFAGRRTLAVISDFKNEVAGFIHGKSESGRTVFIEPGSILGLNSQIAELEIDEEREVQRILRALCTELTPFTPALRDNMRLLHKIDFLRAKALLALSLDATMPTVLQESRMILDQARHPLLYLQNKRVQKATVPLTLELNSSQRLLVISGPNAGGKTVALKTVGLLQVMFQSGLLVPAGEKSCFCFFDKVLVDIGDTQSIENELSTYSGKLRAMTYIVEQANAGSLVLLDEFGSGTDPELGGAIAEAVLEALAASGTLGIVTSHFGNIKVLAEKLKGTRNASMLFNAGTFEPTFILSVGQPGSSYTFEVAERIGFPRYLIERAKQKLDPAKIELGKLLADLQSKQSLLEEQKREAERQWQEAQASREKYQALFEQWKARIDREREQRAELARVAEYGRKYLRLLEEWNARGDRKQIIKKFVDGITAETRKKEALRRQKKNDAFTEKKIARMKETLNVGARVRVLNGQEVGVVEEIRDNRVQVRFGLVKMTVGMENLALAD